MRVTIQIDDQGQAAPEVKVEGQPAAAEAGGGETAAPSAELAARAQALGAMSAGPAPKRALDTGTPGAPAITAPAEDQSPPAVGEAGPETASAGAAPGQPDPRTETESEES